AQDARALRALNLGILLLLFPPVGIMGGILLVAFRYRNADLVAGIDGGLDGGAVVGVEVALGVELAHIVLADGENLARRKEQDKSTQQDSSQRETRIRQHAGTTTRFAG
ncbi:MAG: hypothetical protein ACREUU_12325, partial [Gammaproteobacteria bacterium]